MKRYKLYSWNVNGLRAAIRNGFIDFMNEYKPDVLGVQEIKLQEKQIPNELILLEKNYSIIWNFAERKGYSGTAVFVKKGFEPISSKNKFESEILSKEGRIIELEYREFTFFNIYFPNGQMSEERLKYKLDFYDAALEYFDSLRSKGKKLIITGDYNTAHKEIDLANPKANENRSGFLPVERKWIDKFISHGYIDTFRYFHKEPEKYTWWTYRFKAREKNIGWRIDYFFVSEDLIDNVKDSYILSNVYGSDHCPIVLEIEFA